MTINRNKKKTTIMGTINQEKGGATVKHLRKIASIKQASLKTMSKTLLFLHNDELINKIKLSGTRDDPMLSHKVTNRAAKVSFTGLSAIALADFQFYDKDKRSDFENNLNKKVYLTMIKMYAEIMFDQSGCKVIMEFIKGASTQEVKDIVRELRGLKNFLKAKGKRTIFALSIISNSFIAYLKGVNNSAWERGGVMNRSNKIMLRRGRRFYKTLHH